MARSNIHLDNIRIASPCSADWDAMYGDERKRFCGECKLNVYNLSGMTREEAERLVTSAEGRLCVRFWQRTDGTLLTQDCPVGWAKFRVRTRLFATAAMSMLAALFTGMFFVSLFSTRQADQQTMGVLAERELMGKPVGPMMGNFPVPTPTPEKAPASRLDRRLVRQPADRSNG